MTGGAILSLEVEAVYLFIVGVAVVLLAETLIVAFALRNKPEAKKALLCHVICLTLSFACIAYIIDAPKAPDGGSYNGSGLLGLAGILWFFAEYYIISALVKKK